ncbi:UNVERIFIED_CONTAM: hypothetical protein Sradi_1841800 [Sesamum radiatum]|uniref:Uncharacterized protein n=1 Tax=Sesamum radiatum TaxID=300843 RepID=A0AAW2TWK2_SESRA
MRITNRFKRLTGRSEVAVSARDYKFYAPRHKYRRVISNSISNIPVLPAFPSPENSSSMATSQGYRPPNELLKMLKKTIPIKILFG